MSLLRLVALCLVVACATPPRWKAMVADPVTWSRRHPFSLRVETSGLREPTWLFASPVSNGDFRSALVESIEKSRLFSRVVTDGNADYLLDVFIHFSQDTRETAASAAAKWTLVEVASGRTVFDRIVRASDRMTVDDDLKFDERRRLTDAGAVRGNIERGIRHLVELDLGSEN